MSIQGKYLLNKFGSDKLDTDEISSLSLFLYSKLLSILAKNSNGEIIGVHLYRYRENKELFEILTYDNLIQSSNTFGKLYVHNKAFCLIPNHLFDPSHKELYLNFTADVSSEDMEVFYESVPGSEIQVIGGFSSDLLKKFEKPLPDLEVVPGAVFPLSFLLQSDNFFEDQEIFVFINPGHIYIAAVSLGILVFYNSFTVNSDNDFLKYIFTVIQQLGFDQENTKVNLLGDFSQVKVSTNILSPYFKDISSEMPQQKTSYISEKGLSDFKKTKLLEAFWTL